jgi:hypothetical protein
MRTTLFRLYPKVKRWYNCLKKHFQEAGTRFMSRLRRRTVIGKSRFVELVTAGGPQKVVTLKRNLRDKLRGLASCYCLTRSLGAPAVSLLEVRRASLLNPFLKPTGDRLTPKNGVKLLTTFLAIHIKYLS